MYKRQGCFSSYFKAYDEGDTARIVVLDERYNKMVKILDSCGLGTDGLNSVSYTALRSPSSFSESSAAHSVADFTGRPSFILSVR